jgi:hypothetical protein
MVTGYQLYAADVREGLKLKRPDLNFLQINSIIGAMWKEQSEGDKDYWRKRANPDYVPGLGHSQAKKQVESKKVEPKTSVDLVAKKEKEPKIYPVNKKNAPKKKVPKCPKWLKILAVAVYTLTTPHPNKPVSRQAIKKYILSFNNDVKIDQLKSALKRYTASGDLVQINQSYKLSPTSKKRLLESGVLVKKS